MATEQELIDMVEAMPDTEAFFAPPNAVTNLPDASKDPTIGVLKKYLRFYTTDTNETEQENVHLFVKMDGTATFHRRSNPISESRPEPRVTEEQVRSYDGGVFSDAVDIKISRIDDSADRVTFELPDGAGSFKSKEAIRRYNEDGSGRDVLIRDQVSTV